MGGKNMNTFKVGFSRIDITPDTGMEVAGYFVTRIADGVLDRLYANAVAFEYNGERSVMISLDNLGIMQKTLYGFRKRIAEECNIPISGVFISCTHTHTAPEADSGINETVSNKAVDYVSFLAHRTSEAALAAFADLKNAKMGYGQGSAPGIAFVRRFKMKDGSIATNPGVNNPDIVEPVGDVDESVSVLRFDREGGDTVVMVTFGCHPDVVGGCKYSADWPGFVCSTVERVLDGTKCVLFNGAQGDINHVNVHPTGGFLNGMFCDFDDVSRGYDHARYMGRVITGGVLQAFDKVQYVDVDSLKCVNRIINVPSNKPSPEELPEAKRIVELHQAGRDSELPYNGMMLTTVVAEALRMVNLENASDAFDMTLSGIKIGPVAFVGIPGEPFLGIGKELKATDGYGMIIPVVCANGYEGYFPMMDSYTEGGYEARSSNFRAGVAELMISEGKILLKEMLD